MASDARQIVTLFVFFFGIALVMWRAPQRDRSHLALRTVAAALWCGLLLFEPRTRTPAYGFAVVSFLVFGLGQPFRRRPQSRFPQ